MNEEYKRYNIFVTPMHTKAKKLYTHLDDTIEENDFIGNMIKILLLDMHYFLAESGSKRSLSYDYVPGYLKIEKIKILQQLSKNYECEISLEINQLANDFLELINDVLKEEIE